MPAFGNLLKKLRGEEKQDTVAHAIGCHPSYLSRVENGTVAAPTTPFLARLAAYFGVSFIGLIDSLHWSQAHPTAESLPPDVVPEEGTMRVEGEVRTVAERFKRLQAPSRRQLLHMLDILERSEEEATHVAPKREDE